MLQAQTEGARTSPPCPCRTIYNMCTQKAPHDYSEQLYVKYKEAFTTYIQERVLPSLRDLQHETLLRELQQRWVNHKLMVRWLSRFFNYLDRCGCHLAGAGKVRWRIDYARPRWLTCLFSSLSQVLRAAPLAAQSQGRWPDYL